LNLFFPHNQPNVYLIDNCGRIVNEWTDEANFRPGNSVYLLEDGKLVKCKRDAAIAGDPIWAGGGGEFVEIRDWDNTLLWSFQMNDSLERIHHDVAPMPNGNILMIAWELKTEAEAIALGRDTALLPEGELWPDYVLEVKPIGTDSFDVVWEWHAWDHLIQDLDSTKLNFGNPADHPERIDVNYLGVSGGEADWMHVNSIDYNADLDQILLSVPEFSEIWIIDHSTTTAEAAGSTGGLSGIGGDLMFRWGNPEAYGKGDSSDQTLFYQHNAHWMDVELTSADPDYGKILLYNNRVGADFSTVDVIQPLFVSYDFGYETAGDGTYLPASAEWSYSPTEPSDMYSNILSSAQRLPNGNTLICSGRPGTTIEVTPDEEIVWEYVNPLQQGNPATQGDSLALSSNLMFAMTRYSPAYPGLQGRDLAPGDYLELNPDTAACPKGTVGIGPELLAASFQYYPNPAHDRLVVEFTNQQPLPFRILDLSGRTVWEQAEASIRNIVEVADLAPGLYLIQVEGQLAQKVMIQGR
ncbi:MAG: aryl-sulfate sulfotransferase, partial [Bacteroidota bacterium]